MAEISRNQTSEDAVIALINRDNNLRLSRADVVISNARLNGVNSPIAGTPYVRETSADVLAVKGGDFLENSEVSYHRWHAETIFAKVITVIPPNGQTSTVDLLDDINALYGLQLRENDIIPQSVNIRQIPFHAEIVFKPDNPAWMGKFPVIIRKVPLDIAKYVTARNLPVLRYPTGQSALIQGPLYAYSRDFTDSNQVLTNFNTESSFDLLVPILNAMFTPDTWVNRATAQAFNLGNAAVAYNGPVIPKYSGRTNFTRCLVIQLSNLCSNMLGYLVLHYNA